MSWPKERLLYSVAGGVNKWYLITEEDVEGEECKKDRTVNTVRG